LKGVQIANSTNFLKVVGSKNNKNFHLTPLQQKSGIVEIGELRTIVNLKKAHFLIGEESHNDGDIHVEFSSVMCL
jgi:hypothetical protein